MMVAQRNRGKKSSENWHSFPRVCRRTDSSLNTLFAMICRRADRRNENSGKNNGKNVAMTLAHPGGTAAPILMLTSN